MGNPRTQELLTLFGIFVFIIFAIFNSYSNKIEKNKINLTKSDIK